jgi:hypothetical protein
MIAHVIRRMNLVAMIAVACAATVAGAAMDSAAHATAACNVTVASARNRPPSPVPRSFDYGNASIAVALNPPTGKLIAGRLPSGGWRATINADGSIDAKYGWWRAGDGEITITGRRIDAPAAPLKANVPNGYGSGFQATGLTFPTTGCWRVTGRFKRAQLTFTVLVTKSRLGP